LKEVVCGFFTEYTREAKLPRDGFAAHPSIGVELVPEVGLPRVNWNLASATRV